MTLYDELVARGLIAQVTDEAEIIRTVAPLHPVREGVLHLREKGHR